MTLKLKSASADQLPKPRRLPGSVAVVSADTADQAIAEEVRVLTDYMGGYSFAVRQRAALMAVQCIRWTQAVNRGFEEGLPSVSRVCATVVCTRLRLHGAPQVLTDRPRCRSTAHTLAMRLEHTNTVHIHTRVGGQLTQ